MKKLPARIVLKTPAKINLLLYIRGKRGDGYHDIVTVLQMVDLWDEIIIEEAEGINLITTGAEVPPGRDNLIYMAALRLRECSGIKQGARITLHKVIPVGGGLGGGSSDAAAALFGLNILWGLGYTNDRLMAIGSEMGSDIPFFLNGPSAIGYGRGNDLISLAAHSDYWFLLINPGIHVSTAWAYGQFSSCHPGPGSCHAELGSCHAELGSASKKILKQVQDDRKVQDDTMQIGNWIGPFSTSKIELTKGDGHIKILLPKIFRIEENKLWLLPFNDLEEVVTKRYPIIREIKDKMVACGAMCSLMSGSGSTVFGIFRDRSSAERAYTALQEHGWKSWVVRALHSSPYSN